MSANRTIGGHTLAPQMNEFMDAVEANLDVKGSALAGSVKTSILRAVEKYSPEKRLLYICLNKALEI